jgi:small subunit ribosomal protein S20
VLSPFLIFEDYFGGLTLANHKSAEKRARQSVRRNTRNSNTKAEVKTFERKLVRGIEAKAKDAVELLKAYKSVAMSAVTKGVLRKETVSRHISRLSKRVSSLSAK